MTIFFQATDRSVVGLITKINLLEDANGLPLNLTLLKGKHMIQYCINLLKNLIAKCIVADKAYDFYKIVKIIENQDIKCIIPSRKTSLYQRNYDKYKYKERNII